MCPATLSDDTRTKQIPGRDPLGRLALDDEQPIAGPEIEQMNAKAPLDALDLIQSQERIAEPPHELPFERRQPGMLFMEEQLRDSAGRVLASQSKRNHELWLIVASSESSSQRSSGCCFANELAPEEDFRGGVVAVECRMKGEGEELGERGVPDRHPRRRPLAPAAFHGVPAAAARAWVIPAR